LEESTPTVHVAELEFTPGDWPKDAPALRYITLRFSPLQGELFPQTPAEPALPSGQQSFDSTPVGPPVLKYLAVVTNRPMPPEDPSEKLKPEHMTASEAVRWHWRKAGTIEHVHYWMKDELGAGLLPTQHFGGNAAWFRINVLTYNVLTFLKRRALPPRFRTAQPKRLRFELFDMPGRLTFHQRQVTVDASADGGRIEELIVARGRLLAIHEARQTAATAPDP
jgi:hypothetical protein